MSVCVVYSAFSLWSVSLKSLDSMSAVRFYVESELPELYNRRETVGSVFVILLCQNKVWRANEQHGNGGAHTNINTVR